MLTYIHKSYSNVTIYMRICMLSDSLVDSFAVRVSFQFHIVLLGNLLILLKQRQPDVNNYYIAGFQCHAIQNR